MFAGIVLTGIRGDGLIDFDPISSVTNFKGLRIPLIDLVLETLN